MGPESGQGQELSWEKLLAQGQRSEGPRKKGLEARVGQEVWSYSPAELEARILCSICCRNGKRW